MTIKTRVLVACAVALSVAACSSAPEKAPLAGERMNILRPQQELQAHRAASAVPIEVPAATDVINWPQVGGTSNHVIGNAKVAEEIRQAWRTSVGAGSNKREKLLNPPVVADDKVIMLNAAGDVVAINAANGKRVWRYDIKTKEKTHLKFSGGVAVASGRVFVTTGVGQIHALDLQTGKQVWQQDIGVPIRVSPAVTENRLFVVAHNNRLFVLDQEQGTLLWTHSGIDEPLALLGDAAPAVWGNLVVVPYSSGEIYALREEDGRYLWNDALSFNVQADPFSSLVDVDAAPIIDGDRVFAVNHNGQLSAFRASTGQRLWQQNVSATQMPWLAGNMLYVITEEGKLVAVEKTMGVVTWIRDLNDGQKERKEKRYWTGPVMAGDRLMVASSDGIAVAVEPKNGQVLKHVKLPSGVAVPPVVANGTLYFLTDRGQLVAYR